MEKWYEVVIMAFETLIKHLPEQGRELSDEERELCERAIDLIRQKSLSEEPQA